MSNAAAAEPGTWLGPSHSRVEAAMPRAAERSTISRGRQMGIKASLLGLILAAATVHTACASHARGNAPIAGSTNDAQEVLALSRTKWRLMAERNVDSLAELFHEKAMFVHMTRTMDRTRELEVIRTGDIVYKQADIEAASVRFVDNTAIVLNTIRLTAVVRGQDAVNPFEVTEVYVREAGVWKLLQLSFSRLAR